MPDVRSIFCMEFHLVTYVVFQDFIEKPSSQFKKLEDKIESTKKMSCLKFQKVRKKSKEKSGQNFGGKNLRSNAVAIVNFLGKSGKTIVSKFCRKV